MFIMPFVLVVVITVEKLARMPNVRGHIGTMDYRNTCPRCGKHMDYGTRVCPRCGREVRV